MDTKQATVVYSFPIGIAGGITAGWHAGIKGIVMGVACGLVVAVGVLLSVMIVMVVDIFIDELNPGYDSHPNRVRLVAYYCMDFAVNCILIALLIAAFVCPMILTDMFVGD